jgi:Patatin-like phospholipase
MHYAYIYVLRVQIIGLLLLGSLPPLSLLSSSAVAPLLGGVFDVGPRSIGVIAFLAVLAAAAIVGCSEMVFRYGHIRFGLAELPAEATRPVAKALGIEIRLITWRAILLCALGVLSVVAGLIVAGREPLWARIVAVIVGMLAAFGVLAKAAIKWSRTERGVVPLPAILVFWTPQGYLERPHSAGTRTIRDRETLLPGHLFLSVIGLFTLVVYVAFGVSKWFDIKCVDAAANGATPFYCFVQSNIGPLSLPTIPTLGSILVALTLSVYILSALTFLLDRFRVPLFVPILVLALIGADWPQADHYFDVTPTRQVAVDPSSVLARGASGRAVVIATSGGGIHAAAWTAAVLSRLEDEHGDDWHRSVRLVSAVSGGSVGTMYFLDAIDRGAMHKGTGRTEVFDRASTSSLDDIAWALVYPDFLRLILPMFGWTDRGYAAERAWARLAPGVKSPLSTWRQQVADGVLPAAAFNATIVDSGGRLVMATTDFGKRDLVDGSDRPARRVTFADWFGREYEPSIVGAVRLSASFTYVSPAARIDNSHPLLATRTYHVVDGGYYDNYGVASLVDWLRAALSGANGSVKNVLVVQIRGPMALQDPDSKPGRGLISQVAAPLSTLAHYRSAAQIAHNGVELQLLCEVAGERKVALENVIFQYPHSDVPLSWHLTKTQQEEVLDAAQRSVASEVAHVARFMRGEFAALGQNCDQFR